MSDTTQILRVFDEAQPTRVRDYVDLLKPRVMSLVVFTGLIGVMIAPGHLHPFTAALAVVAIALGSGAAGCLNMWYERDLDSPRPHLEEAALPSACRTAKTVLFARECILAGSPRDPWTWRDPERALGALSRTRRGRRRGTRRLRDTDRARASAR